MVDTTEYLVDRYAAQTVVLGPIGQLMVSVFDFCLFFRRLRYDLTHDDQYPLCNASVEGVIANVSEHGVH